MVTSNRSTKFNANKEDPWLRKLYKKLTAEELTIATDFLTKYETLDKGEFEFKVNRMFLDRKKPKHFTIILDLLTCCNS